MSTIRYDFDPAAGGQGQSGAKLLYVTVAQYSPEWNCVPHTHHCAEIFFVTGGAGTLKLASHSCPLRAGDTVLLDANVEHTELSDETGQMEYIVLGVEGLQCTTRDPGYRVFAAGPEQERLMSTVNWLVREVQERKPGFESICQNLLEAVLVQLARLGGTTSGPAPGTRRASRECAIVHRYIDEHYKEKLTLDELAELAHVSKFYLSHAFSREYGVSPISYLLERRIRESRYLLAETRLTLAEISNVLGFSSPSYFSQSFRRSQGVTPMAYRSSCRRERAG